MKKENVKTFDEKLITAVEFANKHLRTRKIIDMLISDSLTYGYVLTNRDCIRVFTETNCMPFNVNDLTFRKAEKASGIDDLLETMQKLVAEKRVDEAVELNKIRTKMRDELLSRLGGLLYFKKGGKI